MIAWQEHDAVRIKPLILQRVDASENLSLDEVNDRDRSITHPFKIQETILNKEVAFIRRQDQVMRACRCRDGL